MGSGLHSTVIRRPGTPELTLYTRRDCCLCDEMKQTLRTVLGEAECVHEIDVDQSVELQRQFGEEVPVLFINGRKAFKFRVSARELRAKIKERAKRT